MVMFAGQNSIRLSPNFPPRERSKPILSGFRETHHVAGTSELGEELTVNGEDMFEGEQVVQAAQNQSCFPLPKMQIPLFDGISPRWWIRRCERFFQYYNVIECQKVNIAAAYLNDMTDAWYQGWSRMRFELNSNEFMEDFCDRFARDP